jgi:hypothetical protein
VQIVHSQHRGSRDIEHIGSAYTDADLELLRAVARQRLAAGQGELDLRLPGSPADGGAALPITSSRMGHLLDALARGYDVLGFATATGRDEVFRALVLARIIEPTSKLDSVRVLADAGMAPQSYRTVKRRLRLYADGTEETGGEDTGQPARADAAGGPWRARLARACADHVRLGPMTPRRPPDRPRQHPPHALNGPSRVIRPKPARTTEHRSSTGRGLPPVRIRRSGEPADFTPPRVRPPSTVRAPKRPLSTYKRS